MTSRPLTRRRVAWAFAVGVLADVLQLPVSLSLLAGFVPAEVLDAGIDVLAAVVMSWLLGFHWALLPSFALKLIPVVDIAPTWTAGVAYVALQRRRTLGPDIRTVPGRAPASASNPQRPASRGLSEG